MGVETVRRARAVAEWGRPAGQTAGFGNCDSFRPNQRVRAGMAGIGFGNDPDCRRR